MKRKSALKSVWKNSKTSWTDMLRYQENNELHRDFHGTTNATLNFTGSTR